MRKPDTAGGYTPGHLEAVRGACLDLLTTIGDTVEDLVIVGGLVPSLLVDPRSPGGEAHVGTVDRDAPPTALPAAAGFARPCGRRRDVEVLAAAPVIGANASRLVAVGLYARR